MVVGTPDDDGGGDDDDYDNDVGGDDDYDGDDDDTCRLHHHRLFQEDIDSSIPWAVSQAVCSASMLRSFDPTPIH